MRLKFYGTRGSVSVNREGFNRYGGNTTCVQLISDCIPVDQNLFIDAGTGILPAGVKAAKVGIREATILFTHYHHDHTQGLLLTPPTFMDQVRINCFGPEEHGVGPNEMLETIMMPPFHPVAYGRVSHHFRCKGIKIPEAQAMVIHPKGGFKLLEVEELFKFEHSVPAQVKFRQGAAFPISECLVIRMWKTNHPERAISYRFEERPSGKVFVFMTDHENLDGISQDLKKHLLGTDFLVMDSQYKRETYDSRTAQFGHGTPDYCVRVATATGARLLGLTHHDPFSSDEVIDEILQEAKVAARHYGFTGPVIALHDYEEVDV